MTVSVNLRKLSINLEHKSLLISRISTSIQERDLTIPSNCNGFGRIRHFRRKSNDNWPFDPLPLDPACKALGLPKADMIRAQVFQIAACEWRCWYCFVPYNLLSADSKFSAWLTTKELIDLYLKEANHPPLIDLSGGSPNLVPEWIPWMLIELNRRGLNNKVYLWSDDSLSNDFFWRYLTESDRELIASSKNYGRVCCFKGFSKESFAFNTCTSYELFERQFHIMKNLLPLGLDIYVYTTFTTPTRKGISDDMRCFVDRLQQLDEKLPLRTVPLKICEYTPVKERIDKIRKDALENQWFAVEAWMNELEKRFSSQERSENIADIKLASTYKNGR